MLISLQPEGWRPKEKSGEVRAARPEAGAVPGCSEDHHSSQGHRSSHAASYVILAPISQLLKVLKTGQADTGCLRSIRVCSAALIQAPSRLQEPRRSVSCLEAEVQGQGGYGAAPAEDMGEGLFCPRSLAGRQPTSHSHSEPVSVLPVHKDTGHAGRGPTPMMTSS